jgi:thioredoxin 2
VAAPAAPAEVITCPHCGRRNRVPAAATGFPRCGNCHQPLPWIANAADDTFAEVAEAAPGPVVVDLWAPWCGPCRMIAPLLESLASEWAGRVRIAKLNVDENPATASRFNARSIPLLVVIKDGREVDRIIGVQPREEIERRLQRVAS